MSPIEASESFQFFRMLNFNKWVEYSLIWNPSCSTSKLVSVKLDRWYEILNIVSPIITSAWQHIIELFYHSTLRSTKNYNNTFRTDTVLTLFFRCADGYFSLCVVFLGAVNIMTLRHHYDRDCRFVLFSIANIIHYIFATQFLLVSHWVISVSHMSCIILVWNYLGAFSNLTVAIFILGWVCDIFKYLKTGCN